MRFGIAPQVVDGRGADARAEWAHVRPLRVPHDTADLPICLVDESWPTTWCPLQRGADHETYIIAESARASAGWARRWAGALLVGGPQRAKMINARPRRSSQVQATFEKRRCIVPATALRVGERRRPQAAVHVHRSDGQPFAFAGLWSVAPEGRFRSERL